MLCCSLCVEYSFQQEKTEKSAKAKEVAIL